MTSDESNSGRLSACFGNWQSDKGVKVGECVGCALLGTLPLPPLSDKQLSQSSPGGPLRNLSVLLDLIADSLSIKSRRPPLNVTLWLWRTWATRRFHPAESRCGDAAAGEEGGGGGSMERFRWKLQKTEGRDVCGSGGRIFKRQTNRIYQPAGIITPKRLMNRCMLGCTKVIGGSTNINPVSARHLVQDCFCCQMGLVHIRNNSQW